MNPKEKAQYLVERFYRAITRAKEVKSFQIAINKQSFELNRAKRCALIVVDEIVNTDTYLETKSYIQYWQLVKKEIIVL